MNNIINIWKRVPVKLAFLTLVLFQTLTAAAADKVYINDFSIKAGETKLIALNLDSERSDLKRLEGTITLPAGLTVTNQGSAGNAVWMTADATRTNGALAQYAPDTKKMAIVAIGTTFNAGTGAIGYLQVTASTDLADESTITLSGFTAKTASETIEPAMQNCTVTREGGSGGGGGGEEETDDLSFNFNPTTLTMTAGEQKQVDVEMTNGMTCTGLQADLAVSAGLTIVSVTKSSRMAGWNYNPETGRVFVLTPISGKEGTVFTVTLKADTDFSGPATLTAKNLAVTNAGAQSFPAEDITLNVTVKSQKNVALSFSPEKVSLNAGTDATVDVMLDSEVDLTGFMGTLALPKGVTATVAKGALLANNPSYNTNTGRIAYLGGINGNEGALLTLTLTVDENFTADGKLSFTDISTTTAAAQSIVPADIEMDVLKLGWTAPKAVLGMIYNGEAHTLITAGTITGGEMQYSLDGENYSAELPQGTDAKEYTVYYKVFDVNQNELAAQNIKAVIAKADITTVTAPKAKLGMLFTGKAQTLITAGSAEGGEMQYSLDGENYSAELPQGTDAKEYTVYYKVVGDKNHNDVEAENIKAVIAKAESTTTAPKAVLGMIYNGKAHTLITAGSAEGGEMQYSLDGETYATTLPQGTDAKEYTVYYKVVGDKNHNDAEAENIKAVIARKTVGLEWSNTTFDADNAEHQPTVAATGLEGEDVCTVTVEGKGKAVGSYTATATELSNANYQLPEDKSCEFVIVRDMSNLFSDGYEWATYVAQENLTRPDGLEAYVVSKITRTSIEVMSVGYIPVGTGILLKRSDKAADSYKGTAYTGTPENIASLLVGKATEESEMTAFEDFLLYRDEFVLGSISSIPAGRAYLPAAEIPAQAAARLFIVTEDDATPINEELRVKNEESAGAVFDLSGRKVANGKLPNGVYIVNGKKIVIK